VEPDNLLSVGGVEIEVEDVESKVVEGELPVSST
jgi:hypothetical protein